MENTSYSPGGQKHVLDYLRVLHKRRVSAFVTFLLIVAAGAAYTWTAIPTYEARVQLMIETERPRVVVFKDAVEDGGDKADYQETQYKILASRGLASKVLDSLNLWQGPESAGKQPPRSGIRVALDPIVAVGSRLVARFSRKPPPPLKREGPAVDEPVNRSPEIDAFLDNLTVTAIRNSRLVDVKFRSIDPKLAADVVNTLADLYIKQNMEFKSKTSKEASDFLTQQLDEQRKRVLSSERALQSYRERTDDMSTAEREAAAQQKLNEISGALAKAQADRTQKEFVYNQLQSAAGNPKALEIHPSVNASASVQAVRSELTTMQRQERQLRDTLGDRHPDLVQLRRLIETTEARLNSEYAKVIESARADAATAQAQEKNLTELLEIQKRSSTVNRRKQGEYDALEREAASDREIFESLLQRTKETGVSSELMASNIRVVDAADVPHSPISPQKLRDMAIAVMVGLTFGVLVAIGREYMDKRIKTPDEVKSLLGLPCLGLVPVLANNAKGILNGDVPPIFQEAFRALRTSVLFAAAGERSQALLVTSTGPHEGKTMVAANLAISIAQTGRRVLIIDADMRRPNVHNMLDLAQGPGLSGIGYAKWQPHHAIVETSVPCLSMMAAGPLPDNPAELLASERFKAFVDDMTKAFDWVIIDSPPVMAVTDAVLIGHVVGGVIFVVGSESTAAPTALNALERLHSGHARFVGAVLNRVRLQRDSFYYAHHYRPEYQRYFGVKS